MKTDTTTAPTLITGGTGTLGRFVVQRLQHSGHDVRILSRRREADAGVELASGDLATGEGVDAALAGCNVVVHLAGSAKGDEEKARNLVDSASRAGVAHLVYISVVGADRIPVESRLDRAMFGYFAEKHGAERVVAESGIPWTTLRATQFHDLLLTTLQQMTRLPVVPVSSKFRFQPADPDEVAARLVELALGPPSGLVPDFGGPSIYALDAVVRDYLEAGHKRRLLLSMKVPGKAAAALREGANLTPDRAVGVRTWEEFLAERLGTAGTATRRPESSPATRASS